MTDRQKMKFYEKISQKQFNWDSFFFEVLSSNNEFETKTKISYINTCYYFQYTFNELTFDSDSGGWLIEFSPGNNFEPVESLIDHHSFDEVLTDFDNWLNNLIQEIDAKEFLESLRGIQSGIEIVFKNQFIDEEYFSDNEIEKIKNELNNFRQQIRQNITDTDHLRLIDQKIDYLIDRSKYPKIDWINLFVSNIVQLSISGAIYLVGNWDFIIKLKELFINIIKIFNLAIGK